MKKILKFIYKNQFWVKAIALAFLFGYTSSIFIETSRPSGLFLRGAILVLAGAGSIFYFNFWKKYRYQNGGDLFWYAIVFGFWTVLSAGRFVTLIFPHAFDLITEQILHFLWLATALAVFFIDDIVFQSWRRVDYWVGELIKDAKVHLASRVSDNQQAAIDSTQRILHELYAIKNKDKKLRALVPLLEHEHDGVRSWVARFLLQYGDDEKRPLEVFGVLAKKEGYVGEAAQKVLKQWEQDSLHQTPTPLI